MKKITSLLCSSRFAVSSSKLAYAIFFGCFLLTGCEKQLTESNQPNSLTATNAELLTIKATEEKYNITQKIKGSFAIGTTKIQQFSNGGYLAIQKTSAGQKYVLVYGGSTFQPSSVTVQKKINMVFRGTRITIWNVWGCTWELIEDLDTGEAWVRVTCQVR